MIILCLNCGSSSVKYKLFDWDKQEILANGVIERLDTKNSVCLHQVQGKERLEITGRCSDHRTAIQLIMELLVSKEHGVIEDLSEISSVGHRVVHGGERFSKSVIITGKVLNTFKELTELAPLHNPPNILGIEAAKELMPDIPHIAVMDTAWHQTMPKHVYMYALPYEWYEKYGIRKYGFHGTSLLYVSRRAAVLLGKDPFECNLVICHIGNGVSLNAIKYGISYDTSMGFTPLEGLIMGTRPGDHDAAIDFFIMEKEGYSINEMNSILNHKSGILGITGKYIDRRDVEEMAEKGDAKSKLAIDMESYRIKKYIGAYAAAIGGINAVVFTAGVGEKSSIIRAEALHGLEFMGIKLDEEKNDLAKSRNAEFDISAVDSKIKIFVIPTDEERVFIEDVVALYEESRKEQVKYIYRFQMPGYRNSLRDKDFKKECKKNPKLRKVVAKIPETC
jgi:acetate kinase